jgi:hypothetical protein
VFMTNTPDRVEIITSVQRRRRWTASEKVRMQSLVPCEVGYKRLTFGMLSFCLLQPRKSWRVSTDDLALQRVDAALRRRFRNGRYHRFDAWLLWRQHFREHDAQLRPVKRLLQHRKDSVSV